MFTRDRTYKIIMRFLPAFFALYPLWRRANSRFFFSHVSFFFLFSFFFSLISLRSFSRARHTRSFFFPAHPYVFSDFLFFFRRQIRSSSLGRRFHLCAKSATEREKFACFSFLYYSDSFSFSLSLSTSSLFDFFPTRFLTHT